MPGENAQYLRSAHVDSAAQGNALTPLPAGSGKNQRIRSVRAARVRRCGLQEMAIRSNVDLEPESSKDATPPWTQSSAAEQRCDDNYQTQ
jgi:hypothetical protein